MKKGLFFFVILCLLSGCATLCHRCSRNSIEDFQEYPNSTYLCSHRIYPATHMTYCSIAQSCSKYNGVNQGQFHCLSWRVAPFHIIDLPFSFVVDTACVPYDYIRNKEYRCNAKGNYRYRYLSRTFDYFLGASKH